jgi:hypothetical protein
MTKSTIFYLERLLSIVAAVILLQTLYFKFTAAPVSVHIFSTLGIEPWGRTGTGIMELIAGVLLFMPRTSLYGAILAFGIMAGAILSHILLLGIEVQGDGGNLFLLAMIVITSSIGILALKKDEINILLNQFLPKK